jgi:LysM repeat protein
LSVAAKLADVPREKLLQLNPGFLRGATDPDGPHTLLLPRARAELFSSKLESLEPENWISWQRYRSRRGESLATLATRFGIDPQTLQRVNRLDGKSLKLGQEVLIPRIGAATNGQIAAIDRDNDAEPSRPAVKLAEASPPKESPHKETAKATKDNDKANKSEVLEKSVALAAKGQHTPAAATQTAKGQPPAAKATQVAVAAAQDLKPGAKSGQLTAQKTPEPSLAKGAKPLPTKAVPAAPTAKATVQVAAAAPAPAASKLYVVRAGETLEQIARAHGLSQQQLASRNRLPLNSRLRPGQTLACL